MTQNSLAKVIVEIKKAWGPLSTQTVKNCQRLVERLAQSSTTEAWFSDLLSRMPEEQELCRDPDHGFVLLAHSEKEGCYRVPHNHGNGWVIYAVLKGEIEMRTYASLVNSQGELNLVRRESYRMLPGTCKTYLPGDIHDTRCISSSVLMLRFTSCDLKREAREGRLVRYLQPADGDANRNLGNINCTPSD